MTKLELSFTNTYQCLLTDELEQLITLAIHFPRYLCSITTQHARIKIKNSFKTHN